MIILLASNIITIVLAFSLSTLLRFGGFIHVHYNEYSTLIFVLSYSLIILYFCNFFCRYIYTEKLRLFFNIIKLWFTAILFYLVVGFLTKYYFLIDSRAFIILYFFLLLYFMIICHLIIIPYLLGLYYSFPSRRVVCKFIGPDEFKKDFDNFITGYSFLGFLPSSSIGDESPEEMIQEYFLYSDAKHFSELYKEIRLALKDSKPLHVVSKLFDELNLKWEWARVNGIPVYIFRKRDNEHVRKIIRRLIDIVGAVVLMILLLPFFLIIAIAVKLDSKGPVVYKQKRCGQNGKQFIFYKFRSMIDKKNKDLKRELEFKNYLESKTNKGKVVDPDEVTPVGSILRKTSIDELPQLWNVLRGEISLVGPRPSLPYEVKYYKNWHKDRLSIKPGLTGLWQVYGRGNMPCDHSIFFDLTYIINRSITLDMKLIFLTIPAVFFGKGAY